MKHSKMFGHNFLWKHQKGCDDDKIKKTEIRDHFSEWYKNTFHETPPKSTELYDQLDKVCGKRRGSEVGALGVVEKSSIVMMMMMKQVIVINYTN